MTNKNKQNKNKNKIKKTKRKQKNDINISFNQVKNIQNKWLKNVFAPYLNNIKMSNTYVCRGRQHENCIFLKQYLERGRPTPSPSALKYLWQEYVQIFKKICL